MMSNILIYVDDPKHIDDYRKVGVSAFLFSLEGFSVGYNTYTLEEIKNIEVSNKYLLINRVLESNDMDLLSDILSNLGDIKGIVFEDIGVYQKCSDMKIDKELILFQNHFGTNHLSINYWLNKVDSVFVSNELTYEELKNISENVDRPVCMHLYGYNQVMYSRRLLLSNWSEEFSVLYKDSNVIEDIATKVRFRALESKYGTVMYSDKIFNGKDLINLDNIKYFYVNTMMIEHDTVMDFLNDINGHNSDMEDNGFLEKETIYKLKER